MADGGGNASGWGARSAGKCWGRLTLFLFKGKILLTVPSTRRSPPRGKDSPRIEAKVVNRPQLVSKKQY